MIKENDVLDLFDHLVRLKFIKRSGWLERELDSDSIAAHTLDVVVIAWFLASHEKNLDIEKIIKMATIHDLVMAYMEDVTPSSGKYDDRSKLEKKAFSRAFAKTPKVLKGEYQSLWEEFRAQKTKEAKIVRQTDKIATLLQADWYEEQEKRDICGEFLKTYKKFFDQAASASKKIYDLLVERHKQRGYS